MTKKEIEALTAVEKIYRKADKLIQSILERQTGEQVEAQTEQECEQLIQDCQNATQLVNNALGNADLENAITKVINELGVPANIKGYKYLRTAIRLAIEDQDNLDFITKKLYPNVAKEHKTTPARAERAIRHAIEVTYNNYTSSQLEYEIFGNSLSGGKPTNSHFIAAINEFLLHNYNFS